jgi:hypothetical protein
MGRANAVAGAAASRMRGRRRIHRRISRTRSPAEAEARASGELSQHYQLVTPRVDRIGTQRWLRYRFRHALPETYLYQQLDAVTRTQLHEAIGAALEKRCADRPGELPEIALQLARQFEGAAKFEGSGLWTDRRSTRGPAVGVSRVQPLLAQTLLAAVWIQWNARLETNAAGAGRAY